MAKRTGGGKGSIIGVVGGVLIGAAILLFVSIQVLSNLKEAGKSTPDTATINSTVDTLVTFLTICVILLGVLGITIIGSHIIGYISAGFG